MTILGYCSRRNGTVSEEKSASKHSERQSLEKEEWDDETNNGVGSEVSEMFIGIMRFCTVGRMLLDGSWVG